MRGFSPYSSNPNFVRVVTSSPFGTTSGDVPSSIPSQLEQPSKASYNDDIDDKKDTRSATQLKLKELERKKKTYKAMIRYKDSLDRYVDKMTHPWYEFAALYAMAMGGSLKADDLMLDYPYDLFEKNIWREKEEIYKRENSSPIDISEEEEEDSEKKNDVTVTNSQFEDLTRKLKKLDTKMSEMKKRLKPLEAQVEKPTGDSNTSSEDDSVSNQGTPSPKKSRKPGRFTSNTISKEKKNKEPKQQQQKEQQEKQKQRLQQQQQQQQFKLPQQSQNDQKWKLKENRLQNLQTYVNSLELQTKRWDSAYIFKIEFKALIVMCTNDVNVLNDRKKTDYTPAELCLSPEVAPQFAKYMALRSVPTNSRYSARTPFINRSEANSEGYFGSGNTIIYASNNSRYTQVANKTEIAGFHEFMSRVSRSTGGYLVVSPRSSYGSLYRGTRLNHRHDHYYYGGAVGGGRKSTDQLVYDYQLS
jgi:hypothetical protein